MSLTPDPTLSSRDFISPCRVQCLGFLTDGEREVEAVLGERADGGGGGGRVGGEAAARREPGAYTRPLLGST